LIDMPAVADEASKAAASLAAMLAADPERYYGSPYQLAWDHRLGKAKRLEALRRWLEHEGDAYRRDRRPVHLNRIRDLHNAIHIVEIHAV
jgi:hypothetical protein